MKRLIHSLLRSRGYDIIRANKVEPSALAEIRKIFNGCPPTILFDVGANEGQTAIGFSSAFPQAIIHSFEPFHDAFLQLQKLASRQPRIRPVKLALGDKIGSHEFCLNTTSVTNSLLPAEPEARSMIDPRSTTEVQVSTIDEYCRETGIHSVDILKIDTQGYDLKVLQGSERLIAANQVAVVFAEVLFVPLYVGQAYFHHIYEHLAGRGFWLVGLYDVEVNVRKYASWANALFVSPEGLRKMQRA